MTPIGGYLVVVLLKEHTAGRRNGGGVGRDNTAAGASCVLSTQMMPWLTLPVVTEGR